MPVVKYFIIEQTCLTTRFDFGGDDYESADMKNIIFMLGRGDLFERRPLFSVSLEIYKGSFRIQHS